jgi:hypothetical protein
VKVAAKPGLIVLFGSGETSPSGQKVFDWLLRQLPVPVQVAILETPAGFELNSPQVAGRIASFFSHNLQNYRPRVTVVPARKRGTPFSPDAVEIAAMIPGKDAVFLGPGSPTYAVRQLQDSLAWRATVTSHLRGTALVMASAATIAAAAYALPVYEIYKVGEDPHWKPGLDFFSLYGLSLVLVPHWNNQDGGEELDTSRCYMGRDRFDSLLEMLPPGPTVVGIDEQTALILDLATETCRVMGRGGVTVLSEGKALRFEQGQTFSVRTLGPLQMPGDEILLPPEVAAQVQALQLQAREAAASEPPPQIVALVGKRETARSRGDWAVADALRARIEATGWRISDTPEGPRLESIPEEAP